MCRVFKKTCLIIPKPKVEKSDRRNGSNERRDKTESQDEETRETAIEGMEAEDYIEESLSPYNNFYNNSSATSSISDLTQGCLLDEKEVTMDDYYPNPSSQPFTKFAASGHEANSNSSSLIYSINIDYSDLFQV